VKPDVYGGREPRELPAYAISEVARYLVLPTSTLRSWTLGQYYEDRHGERRLFKPLIQIADPDLGMMSFMDFIEAHVLSAIRRKHEVKLGTIRGAVKRIRSENPNSRHPLAEVQFATVGKRLFIEEVGRLVSLSDEGQLGLSSCLEDYLNRIDREPSGIAVRLFPFSRKSTDAPKKVSIDPRVAFGRPVITGTSIPTSTIHERWRAGESTLVIAEDYDRPLDDIDEALRWETLRAA
jgi:uncharacterized protein (DUF433 family)